MDSVSMKLESLAGRRATSTLFNAHLTVSRERERNVLTVRIFPLVRRRPDVATTACGGEDLEADDGRYLYVYS